MCEVEKVEDGTGGEMEFDCERSGEEEGGVTAKLESLVAGKTTDSSKLFRLLRSPFAVLWRARVIVRVVSSLKTSDEVSRSGIDVRILWHGEEGEDTQPGQF